jgi:hypothetical protein
VTHGKQPAQAEELKSLIYYLLLLYHRSCQIAVATNILERSSLSSAHAAYGQEKLPIFQHFSVISIPQSRMVSRSFDAVFHKHTPTTTVSHLKFIEIFEHSTAHSQGCKL